VVMLGVLSALCLVSVGQGAIAQQPSRPVIVAQSSERAAIEKVLLAKIRQTSAAGKPTVEKVAIADNFALATWSRGEVGGTALLRKSNGSWKILTSGGGWINKTTMREYQVSDATAEKLLSAIDPNWRQFE